MLSPGCASPFCSSLFTKHEEAIGLLSAFCQASPWHTPFPFARLAGTIPDSLAYPPQSPLPLLLTWGILCGTQLDTIFLFVAEDSGEGTHSRHGSLGKPGAGWNFKALGGQETWESDLLVLPFSHVGRRCLAGADYTGVVVKDCLRDAPPHPPALLDTSRKLAC